MPPQPQPPHQPNYTMMISLIILALGLIFGYAIMTMNAFDDIKNVQNPSQNVQNPSQNAQNPSQNVQNVQNIQNIQNTQPSQKVIPNAPSSKSPLLAPFICPSYDRYLSHLSTKTPYSYRHSAFQHQQCNSDPNRSHANPAVSNNSTDSGRGLGVITSCTGSVCPLQLTPIETSFNPSHQQHNQDPNYTSSQFPLVVAEPSKVCRLKHISHLNRHGTRNPTQAGQIDKTSSLILKAQKAGGLVNGHTYNDNDAASIDTMQNDVVLDQGLDQKNISSKSILDQKNISSTITLDQKNKSSTTTTLEPKSNSSPTLPSPLLSWITPSLSMDPTFRPENGGHLSDLGRLELFGIGRRLRQRVELGNFHPDVFSGSVTFKKRTLQSLLALLCGLGLYDIEGARTGGQMKKMVGGSMKMTIDGVLFGEPHVRILIPPNLTAPLSHLISTDLHFDPRGYYRSDDRDGLLKLIHAFEKGFVQEITKRYPIEKHPKNTPLLIKIVTFDQTLNTPSVFALTIPPNGDGDSPLVELAGEYNLSLYSTLHKTAQSNAQITETRHTDSEIVQGDAKVAKLTTFEDYEQASVDFYQSDPYFVSQWNNAILRYFDECGQYDVGTTKSPAVWGDWMEGYLGEVCGIGSHCDFALHRIFTHDYIDQELLTKGRLEVLKAHLGRFYQQLGGQGAGDCKDIDLEQIGNVLMSEITDKYVELFDLKNEKNENNDGKLTDLSVSSHHPIALHGDDVKTVQKAMVDWIIKIITETIEQSAKGPGIKVSDKALKKAKKANKNKKGGKGDENDQNGQKVKKTHFPLHFHPNPDALSTLFGIIINNLPIRTGNGDKIVAKEKFRTSVDGADAKSRASVIKKLYGLCSLQLSVHSPFIGSTDYTPVHQSGPQLLVQRIPFSEQFCRVLGEENYDFLVQKAQEYKKSPNFTLSGYKSLMTQLYNDVNKPGDGEDAVTIEGTSSGNVKPTGSEDLVKKTNQGNHFDKETINSHHKTTPLDKKISPDTTAVKNDSKSTPITNLTQSDRPNHGFAPDGSALFYQFEYLTDIAQLAKKGAFEKITLGSACPLLETLLPALDANDNKTSMSVYGAHAETVLPLVALITGSPRPQKGQNGQNGGIDDQSRPSIPPPKLDNLHNETFLYGPDDIYQFGLIDAVHKKSGSLYLDGLLMLKGTEGQNNDDKDDNKDDKNEANNNIDHIIDNSNNNIDNNNITIVDPSWRSSFHTPMAANIAVHVYECEDIDVDNEESEKNSSKNSNNKTLYAQLLMNEEPIPWPSAIGLPHHTTGETHLNGSIYRSEHVGAPEDLQRTRMVLNWLIDYKIIKGYFAARYQELGMGSCNIKDWNMACFAPGYNAKSNAADDD